jgi:hypothetical protein
VIVKPCLNDIHKHMYSNFICKFEYFCSHKCLDLHRVSTKRPSKGQSQLFTTSSAGLWRNSPTQSHCSISRLPLTGSERGEELRSYELKGGEKREMKLDERERREGGGEGERRERERESHY